MSFQAKSIKKITKAKQSKERFIECEHIEAWSAKEMNEKKGKSSTRTNHIDLILLKMHDNIPIWLDFFLGWHIHVHE